MRESTDDSNRARAYGFSASMSNLPTFIAPLVGAALCRPAERYDLFRGIRLFQRFPYFLPSLAMGALGIFATVMHFFFLKEVRPDLYTLEKKD
jgi:MFS family permease